MGRWDVTFFGRVAHYFESEDYSDVPICGKIFKSVFSGGEFPDRDRCKKCECILVKQKLTEVKQPKTEKVE